MWDSWKYIKQLLYIFCVLLVPALSGAAELPKLSSLLPGHKIHWKQPRTQDKPSALCNFEKVGFHKIYESFGFGYFFEDSVYSSEDNKSFIFQSSSMVLNRKKRQLLSLGKGDFLYWQPSTAKKQPLFIMTEGVSQGTLKLLLSDPAGTNCPQKREIAAELVDSESSFLEAIGRALKAEADAISQKQNWVDAMSGCFIDGLGSIGVSLWEEGAWGYASRLYMETLGRPFERGVNKLIHKYRENPESLTLDPLKLYRLHKVQIKDLKENLWPILDSAYEAAKNGIKNFTELPQREQSKILCQLGAGAAGGTGSAVLLKSLKNIDFSTDLKEWASLEGQKKLLGIPSRRSLQLRDAIKEMPSVRVPQTQALRHKVRAQEGPEFQFLPRPDARDWAVKQGLIREFSRDSREKIELEPGAYNFVVRENGDFVVGRVDHDGEFGVRHSSLANEQSVVAGGQLKILDEEDPQFNIRSGTFSTKLADAREDRFSQEPQVQNLLSTYFQEPVTKTSYTESLAPSEKPSFFDMMKFCQVPSFQKANRKKCCQLFRIGCDVL